jgi:catechol 2,3-dioxygenase-like lactoylglutathione lyase family enzyme
MEAAQRFYTDVIGLTVQRQHPTFVQFDYFAIASDQPLGGSTKDRELYWLIDDAENAFAELPSSAEVTMPLQELPFGKVFGIKGPSGGPCFMLQLAQNRPSEAV